MLRFGTCYVDRGQATTSVAVCFPPSPATPALALVLGCAVRHPREDTGRARFRMSPSPFARSRTCHQRSERFRRASRSRALRGAGVPGSAVGDFGPCDGAVGQDANGAELVRDARLTEVHRLPDGPGRRRASPTAFDHVATIRAFALAWMTLVLGVILGTPVRGIAADQTRGMGTPPTRIEPAPPTSVFDAARESLFGDVYVEPTHWRGSPSRRCSLRGGTSRGRVP